MHSYSIYINLSHYNQLMRLRPDMIQRIMEGLEDVALQYNGRAGGDGFFYFTPSLGEITRKIAEAAWIMHTRLIENERDLHGTTVLVFRSPGDGKKDVEQTMETLLLQIPDDNGLWLAPEIENEFKDYFDISTEHGMPLVKNVKETGPGLAERLPELLIRQAPLTKIRKTIEKMEHSDKDHSILLLRGSLGSGKRATLKQTLRLMHPDDGGAPITIPLSDDTEDPMEPFIRSMPPPLSDVGEYLDEEERLWWETEGYRLLGNARKEGFWHTSRDQAAVDLVQSFALYVRASIERRRQAGRIAYLILDGFSPESEPLPWIRILLTEFLDQESFRLIVIWDSDQFKQKLPLPGAGYEVMFRDPKESEWRKLVHALIPDDPAGLEQWTRSLSPRGPCLYSFFHYLLAREKGFKTQGKPSQIIFKSLDKKTQNTLFLAHAAAGLATRSLLTDRAGNEDYVQVQEEARYDGLIAYGFIREDPDGKTRPIPDIVRSVETMENLREAEHFGEFLFQQYESGKKISLLRLYRYLEKWGPVYRAIRVLDYILESLITNRRLRTAGIILNQNPFSQVDITPENAENVKNIVESARLRYLLLTKPFKDVQKIVQNQALPDRADKSGYVNRFRLNDARYSYAAGLWEKALSTAKEVLFFFQKAGDHEGETHAHMELALALLALGKVRDALGHFGVARRIGRQISASWGVLRASAMESSAQFIFGNISHAMRECRKYRELSRKEGRRDIWMLLTLLSVRISWELGRYGETFSLAEEGRRTAVFYKLPDEERVMTHWKGRALLAQGNQEGKKILLNMTNLSHADDAREAHAFLSEAAWWNNDMEEAQKHITLASAGKRRSTYIQGEADDWTDGFFPIEGRLADGQKSLDVLDEWISGFKWFLTFSANPSDAENDPATQKILSITETINRRVPHPYSYQYSLWIALSLGKDNKDLHTRMISRGFNELQNQAGRFDDNQAKHEWLTANPWNKRLVDETHHRRSF